MTMINVVKTLRKKGFRIVYHRRTDGGILIKSINGKKYTGASGNAAARELSGTVISEARIHQLQYATRSRAQIRKRKLSGLSIDEQIYNEFKRVKKKWNRRFKAKEGKPHPAGYFTWEHIQWTIEHESKEEALRRISEAERYTSGLAYSKNVQQLAAYIRMAGEQYESDELIQLAEDVEAAAWKIKEEWITHVYEALYDLNKGKDPHQVAKNVRRILRLL